MIQIQSSDIVEADFIKPLRDALPNDDAGGGLHGLSLTCKACLVAVAADAPGAVAAHFAHASVGVEKQHFVIAALAGGFYNHQTVGADGQVSLAECAGDGGEGLVRQLLFQIVQDQEVVACAVHFPEFQIGSSFGCFLYYAL